MTKAAATLLLSVCAISLGENAQGQEFEVASVKPSDPAVQGTVIQFPNGSTFKADGITARDCIAFAFETQPFQISGGPSWIGGQRYDILAKMPADAAGAPRTPERIAQMRAALKAPLSDRFRLMVHNETKALPGYALVARPTGAARPEAGDAKGAGGNDRHRPN